MQNKTAALQSAGYKLLVTGFTEWLQLLNYSPLSVPSLTTAIRNFLSYQEQNNKSELSQLQSIDANHYIAYLQNKIGERTKKPLSNNHINKQIQALRLLSKYLRATGQNTTAFSVQRLVEERSKPAWLSKKEIAQLYQAIPDSVLGIRDHAMLALFYGCGLRLNEGASIELKDINHSSKIVHVRKGKQYKERLVPIAEKNYQALAYYISQGRPQLLQSPPCPYLFIDANKGQVMHKQSLYIRIKQLVKTANIKKQVGTHTLRHSIATHLLQSGMKLERIQQFLGHASLDSTQIYTHLSAEEADLQNETL